MEHEHAACAGDPGLESACHRRCDHDDFHLLVRYEGKKFAEASQKWLKGVFGDRVETNISVEREKGAVWFDDLADTLREAPPASSVSHPKPSRSRTGEQDHRQQRGERIVRNCVKRSTPSALRENR